MKRFWVGYEWAVPMWGTAGATDREITAADKEEAEAKAFEWARLESGLNKPDFKIVYFKELKPQRGN